jgi:hypothetical protein
VEALTELPQHRYMEDLDGTAKILPESRGADEVLVLCGANYCG